MMRRALALAALVWLNAPAAAERVIAVVGSERIAITSNFTGTEIVLFGAIETDQGAPSAVLAHEVVVVVRGPAKTMVTREKLRRLGIWANGPERTFMAAPSYYKAISTAPFEAIAPEHLLGAHEIGLAHLRLDIRRPGPAARETGTGDPTDPEGDIRLRVEFTRLMGEAGVWREAPGAIDRPARNVFRARAAIPANAPIGIYAVHVLVFAQGEVIARATTTFEVEKAGFEQQVFEASRRQAWAYGVGSVLLALAIGWLAGALFRRN